MGQFSAAYLVRVRPAQGHRPVPAAIVPGVLALVGLEDLAGFASARGQSAAWQNREAQIDRRGVRLAHKARCTDACPARDQQRLSGVRAHPFQMLSHRLHRIGPAESSRRALVSSC